MLKKLVIKKTRVFKNIILKTQLVIKKNVEFFIINLKMQLVSSLFIDNPSENAGMSNEKGILSLA